MVLELVQERCMNLLVEAVAQTKALFVLLHSIIESYKNTILHSYNILRHMTIIQYDKIVIFGLDTTQNAI